MSVFLQQLEASWRDQNSLLCVGLDPDIHRIPSAIAGKPDSIFTFNKEIIDATAEWSCAYKPQIAYYAAVGAEDQLEKTIRYIKTHYPNLPVILDAKRGDIGATAEMYAKEAFERYGADAVTVNPYMGGDTLRPYLSRKDKGVIILCRTSNPGSGDFQELKSSNLPVSHHVATRAAREWNDNHNVALVIGATYPTEIGSIRQIVGDMPLLIPGIGAQGGDLQAVLASGLTERKSGLLISVSRSVMYASNQDDFADAAAKEVEKMCRQINDYR